MLARCFGAITLFLFCTGVAISQPPGGGEIPPGGGDGPTGTATIGPVGVEKGKVRVDCTWDKCGNDASKASLKLYKGTKSNQGAATELNEISTTPAGNSGKNGGDYGDPTKLKSGDKYDKDSKVIVEKVTGDFTVP